MGLFFMAVAASGQSNQENLLLSCRKQAGEKAIYLKDFIIKFPEAKNIQEIPVSRNYVIMSKGIVYRFTTCSSEQFGGEAIIQVWDEKRMLLTNLVSGKIYPSFDFICQKTGKYQLLISFREGKAGEAVSIMSYLKN